MTVAQKCVNEENLPILVNRYLKHCDVQGMQPITIDTYRFRLGLFLSWCEERGIEEISQIGRGVMEAYCRHLRFGPADAARELRPASRINILASVKTFFRWLSKKRLILYNPMADITQPVKPPPKFRETLTKEEIEHVLSLPDLTHPVYFRDRVMMEVFYATGIRRRELADLDLADLNGEDETLIVRRGKNGLSRLVPLGNRASGWLDRYLKKQRREILKHRECTALFLATGGSRMSVSLIEATVKKYLKAAGITKKGCCHLFRHSMATLMLKNGADIRVIQEILGHTCIETTQRYTHLTIDHLKQIHSATHPGR